MKRYRLTESNLRNMIRECIEDTLYEGKVKDTFNKAVKYGKKQLNKFNQSIKDLTDEYDEDGNPIVDNPMYKGKKSNNESRLRNMVREAIDEAFNNQQYAYMAGVAANRANSWRAKFDPKYAERKRRQMQRFGHAATSGGLGVADQNLMNNDQQNGGARYRPNNSNYEFDSYSTNFNGDNKNQPAYNIRHAQFNGMMGDYEHGDQHNQMMDNGQYRQELRQNDPNYIENLDQISAVSHGNTQLNKAFNQGRQQKQIDRQTMRDMGQGNTARTRGLYYWH